MKAESRERQEMLQERIETHVCSQCGGGLFILQFEDCLNTPGCATCSQIMWGVIPDVFAMAKEYVTEHNLHHYPIRWHSYMSEEVRKVHEVYAEQSNIDKMCEIIMWVRSHDKGDGE